MSLYTPSWKEDIFRYWGLYAWPSHLQYSLIADVFALELGMKASLGLSSSEGMQQHCGKAQEVSAWLWEGR